MVGNWLLYSISEEIRLISSDMLYIYIYRSGVSRFHSDSARHRYAALKRSGHSYQLTYKPDPNKSSKDKCRTRPRHITWYNPPFDMNVKNNVGRIFLGIVNSSFPEGHALKPIFNRNTLKLSYSCMPNVKNAIEAHNKTQLKKPAAEPPKNCNCRDKPSWPLNGECRAKSIVYQATVTNPRTGPNNVQ